MFDFLLLNLIVAENIIVALFNISWYTGMFSLFRVTLVIITKNKSIGWSETHFSGNHKCTGDYESG